MASFVQRSPSFGGRLEPRGKSPRSVSVRATIALCRCCRNSVKASRTTCASTSFTRSFLSFSESPKGTGPPVRFAEGEPCEQPLRREAAILSRVRSEIMDRSNSAKLINMLSVSRPIASAFEKFCVTDTNDTPAAVKRCIILAKSSSERLRRSTL
jgi:hypothetical protein